jgi:hypothetical protein
MKLELLCGEEGGRAARARRADVARRRSHRCEIYTACPVSVF